MSHTPREILTDIVARHGEALLQSPLRCEGLLKDYCGDNRREIFALTSCLRSGIVEQMRTQSGPSIKLICARLALKLEQNLAISGDIAKWAVESWAVALNLMKPEQATVSIAKIYEAAVAARAAQAAAGAESLAPTPVAPQPAGAEDEAPMEFLAEEPEPGWAVPDWTAPSATMEVYPDGTGQRPTLREAVREAAENACLILKPGLYRESMVIKKNLHLCAEENEAPVTLEAGGSAAVFILEGACLRLDRLVIRGVGGKDKRAQAAVEIKSGRLEMQDCNLTSDAATVLEVRGEQSEAVVRRSHLHGGKAGGVLFTEGGGGYLEECHLYQNKLSQVVIGKGSAPVLFGCKISHALMAGIYISEGGEGLVENCDIWGNAVGGVQCRRGGNPRLRYCRISANQRYGVLVAEKGEGLFEHCQIFENEQAGVAISQQSVPRFASCRIFDNRGEGVEFSAQGQGELLDCEIFANERANVSVKGASTPALFRCVVHDGRQEGLVIAEKSGGRFEACEFSSNILSGVVLTESEGPVFQQCVLHHGHDCGLSALKAAEAEFIDCEFAHHAGTAVLVGEKARPRFERCHVRENGGVAVHVDDAAPVFQACVIEHNAGTAFACTQNATPWMTEGEIAENGGGLAVGSQGKGRWERVQFLGNHGDSVLVAEGGKPALLFCHIEGAERAGLRFQAEGEGTVEDVAIVGSGGPGIEIEGGGNPSLKQVKVTQGKGPGIVVLAEGAGTAEACEASENAGGDWLLDETSKLVRV